jgi:TolA-binding protein
MMTLFLRRNPRCERRQPLPGWALLLVLAPLLASACAKTSDVEQLQQANTVQDRRIQALEQATPQAIQQLADQLKPELEKLAEEMRVLLGRSRNEREQVQRLSGDQTLLAETLERLQAIVQKLQRRVDTELKAASVRGLEVEKALDGVRGQLTGLESLLQSRMADLPQKTKADRAWREAYFQLINGELDVAAAAFADFRTKYGDDPRAVEALYRQGQAYFLRRKYDEALVPCLELVEKHGDHPLAADAKWMLARSLEETGDLKLAREFYAQLIAQDTPHKRDATRRLFFIDRLTGVPAPAETPAEGAPPDGAAKPDGAVKPDGAAKPTGAAQQTGAADGAAADDGGATGAAKP